MENREAHRRFVTEIVAGITFGVNNLKSDFTDILVDLAQVLLHYVHDVENDDENFWRKSQDDLRNVARSTFTRATNQVQAKYAGLAKREFVRELNIPEPHKTNLLRLYREICNSHEILADENLSHDDLREFGLAFENFFWIIREFEIDYETASGQLSDREIARRVDESFPADRTFLSSLKKGAGAYIMVLDFGKVLRNVILPTLMGVMSWFVSYCFQDQFFSIVNVIAFIIGIFATYIFLNRRRRPYKTAAITCIGALVAKQAAVWFEFDFDVNLWFVTGNYKIASEGGQTSDVIILAIIAICIVADLKQPHRE